MEAEFAAKLKELEEKHAKEIAEAEGSGAPSGEAAAATTSEEAADPVTEGATAEEEERERKQAKARRKREKAKEKERERELAIERENAEAGPSMRQIEVEQIQNQISPLGFTIAEIPSDGNCLYRAVAAHSGSSYQQTRKCVIHKEFCRIDTFVFTSNHFSRKPMCRHSGGKRIRVCPLL